jgi:hypothetical protein
MDRRSFLRAGVGAALWGGGTMAAVPSLLRLGGNLPQSEDFPLPPVRSLIPVVGDGKWIWTAPPSNQTGYLEPRDYELKVGIQIEGTGPATQIAATTAVPVVLPEQEINRHDVESNGLNAVLRPVAAEAGQLFVSAPGIVKGQVLAAIARFHVTLRKEYHAHAREQFPAAQKVSKDFAKLYMYDSPGIQTRAAEVRDLAARVGGQIAHPWDKALAFHNWVWENIEGKPGPYTSVVAAIRERVGDCEERAAVFVALCRASGIPARLVWVPNHNWAEFYLHDESGEGRWIPSHTSCYSWFGWTGAHELVIQKGDTIHVPEKKQPVRLVPDWMQWQGSRPKATFGAELVPLPPKADEDAGPGSRRKDAKGEWIVIGKHPLDLKLRDGERARPAVE